MKKVIALLMIVSILSVTTVGCFTQTHVVGDGAQGNTQVEEKHWFILFGLVPLNDVDSKALAGGAEDYTIVTQHTFLDYVISIFTGIVTVYPTTVKVTK